MRGELALMRLHGNATLTPHGKKVRRRFRNRPSTCKRFESSLERKALDKIRDWARIARIGKPT